MADATQRSPCFARSCAELVKSEGRTWWALRRDDGHTYEALPHEPLLEERGRIVEVPIDTVWPLGSTTGVLVPIICKHCRAVVFINETDRYE